MTTLWLMLVGENEAFFGGGSLAAWPCFCVGAEEGGDAEREGAEEEVEEEGKDGEEEMLEAKDVDFLAAMGESWRPATKRPADQEPREAH
mmetsp:Transcript_85448/g.178526  ORF Transcript_85448/g.178526 Transcript_85448/m.178526 type:complete len:90 (-) Transcript_85448:1083-1352(-)